VSGPADALPELRRMGRAALEEELAWRREVPDLRQHRVPCLFSRGCPVCDPPAEAPAPAQGEPAREEVVPTSELTAGLTAALTFSCPHCGSMTANLYFDGTQVSGCDACLGQPNAPHVGCVGCHFLVPAAALDVHVELVCPARCASCDAWPRGHYVGCTIGTPHEAWRAHEEAWITDRVNVGEARTTRARERAERAEAELAAERARTDALLAASLRGDVHAVACAREAIAASRRRA